MTAVPDPGAAEAGAIDGMTLLCIDFCAQPESWPVFHAFIVARGVSDAPALPRLLQMTRRAASARLLGEQACQL